MGPGALVALTYRSAGDDPTRFGKSSTVGAYFGLTPKKYQSGETDRDGDVSKVGDAMVRTALFEAAHIMLTRATRFSGLKHWALDVAKTPRHEARQGGPCPQVGRRAPSYVGGCDRVPLVQGRSDGIGDRAFGASRNGTAFLRSRRRDEGLARSCVVL